MANVPEELINEILLRLPAKSLLRFRCVCESFCASIGSQSFINSHFKRSSENNIHRKLIDLGVHSSTDDYRLNIHASDFNNDIQQELVIRKQFSSRSDPAFFCYCNGLVLLLTWPQAKLSVWNPSTRKYRTLPALPVEHTRNLNFALGYDSTTDDYKAVVIIWNEGGGFSQVWIFELRSSCWRMIQDFPYVCNGGSIEACTNGDCFVDGAVHFMCYHRDGSRISHRIVAFDVANETFSVIQEPVIQETVPEFGSLPIGLHSFGGRLSICFWNMIMGKGMQVDIYVRKKDGDAFTWTRLNSVAAQQVSGKSFGCYPEGGVAYSEEGYEVVFFFSNFKLHSYDLKEESIQEIVTENTVFSCTESLVSVGSQDED